jgi:1-deoxy-D-xylulose-5-phosphate synthase
MVPSNENETYKLLSTGYFHNGPAAVRYPRGKGPGTRIEKNISPVSIGKAILRREGHSVAILAFGSMVDSALKASEILDATVVDMRFVKPIDEEIIGDMAASHRLIVTLEENTVMGGAGSAVNEFLLQANYQIPILNLGLPDRFLEHGKATDMLSEINLDSKHIANSIRRKLKDCKIQSEAV